MAFPTVANQSVNAFLVDATNHNVGMPATVNAGELLLCLFCNDGSATVTTPSGWTQRWSLNNGSNVRLSAYYRIADGSEGGTQVNFVTSAAETAVARVYRITNWHGTSAPEAATATGSTSTPDPPAVTPSWGAQDTLWIACHGRSSTVTLSSYPTDYSNGTNDSSGSGTTHAQLAVARRELAAASENPVAFTLSGSAAWVAATVAVAPAGAAAGQPGRSMQQFRQRRVA